MDHGDWYGFAFVVLVEALSALFFIARARWQRRRKPVPPREPGVRKFQIALGILLAGSVLTLQLLVFALHPSLLGGVLLTLASIAFWCSGFVLIAWLARRGIGD